MNQLAILLSTLTMQSFRSLKMKDVPEDKEYRGSIKCTTGMKFDIFLSQDPVSHEPCLFAWVYIEENGYASGSWQLLLEL